MLVSKVGVHLQNMETDVDEEKSSVGPHEMDTEESTVLDNSSTLKSFDLSRSQIGLKTEESTVLNSNINISDSEAAETSIEKASVPTFVSRNSEVVSSTPVKLLGSNQPSTKFPEELSPIRSISFSNSRNSDTGSHIVSDVFLNVSNSSSDSRPSGIDDASLKSDQFPNTRQPRRDPLEAYREKCGCSDPCLWNVTPNVIAGCQDRVMDLSGTVSRQFILTEITKHCAIIRSLPSRLQVMPNFLVSGTSVCPKAWCIAHNICYRRYQRCLVLFKDGKKNIIHGNFQKKRMSEKTASCISWMRTYFDRIGDFMPHKTQIHLPQTLTKLDIYNRMTEELMAQGQPKNLMISRDYFYEIWSNSFSHVIIPKTKEFTECSTCIQLKEALVRNQRESSLEKVKAIQKDHLLKVSNERAAYHDARTNARRNPDQLTAVIIDGMDQSKTDVPHFVQADKGTAHLSRLPTHLTGVLLHTGSASGKLATVFRDLRHVPHDSNLTIHCLMHTLSNHRDRLGKALFIQMDNCYRENKNRFLLSFCSLLVHLSVFEEVTVHFLPVGHTHEDVDQMFSCISAALKRSNVYTLQDFDEKIRDSYTPSISVQPVTSVLNVKEWIQPYIAGAFGNHSKPLWFRFHKVQGATVMHYRKWVSDSWLPEDNESSNGLICLKAVPDPDSVPEWVVPSLEKADIPKLSQDMPAYRARFTGEHITKWWEKFLQEVWSMEEVPDDAETWILKDLMGLASTHDNDEASDVSLPENVQRVDAILQEPLPPVYIGEQGRPPKAPPVNIVDDYSDVKPGVMVAVHLESETRKPYIGKVTAVANSEVAIIWFKGSYSGSWKEWLVGKIPKRRPYEDTVPLSSLILWDFTLTNKNRLNTHTVTELKKKYEELEQN